ncbi:hypothetical protein HY404_02570 [Candidatus Microgenomates bacterium]|nr:hypothetical protein [Candidatus Microgenomates bacterium]
MLQITKIIGRQTDAWSEVYVKNGLVILLIAPSQEIGSPILKEIVESNNLPSTLHHLPSDDITAIALLFKSGYVRGWVLGNVQLNIGRNGKTGILVAGKKGEAKSVNGPAKPGDTLLLTTTSLFAAVPDKEITAGLVNPTSESFSQIASFIGKYNKDLVASVFVHLPAQAGLPRSNQGLSGKKFNIKVVRVKLPKLPQASRRAFSNTIFLSSLFLKRLRRREIYISENHPKRSAFIMGISFLVMVTLVVVIGMQRSSQETALAKYQPLMIQIGSNLQASKDLVELNAARSQELARQVKNDLASLAADSPKNKNVLEFINQTESDLNDLLGEYRVTPSVLVDLSLVRDGFQTGEVALDGEKITVLDNQKRLLISFDFAGRNMKVLAGPDTIPQARLVAIDDGQVFVLDGQRVARIEQSSSQTTARSAIIPEGSWGRISHLAAFTGNLYLLDSAKNQIWRYSEASSERAGAGEAWLAKDTVIDLSNINSMAIDGYLWLLDKNGQISRLSRGNKVGFNVTGLEKAWITPVALFTAENLKNLYILDAEKKRVVVIDKSGVYHAQYLSDQLKEATNLVVSEENKKMLIFAGSKVYEIELK